MTASLRWLWIRIRWLPDKCSSCIKNHGKLLLVQLDKEAPPGGTSRNSPPLQSCHHHRRSQRLPTSSCCKIEFDSRKVFGIFGIVEDITYKQCHRQRPCQRSQESLRDWARTPRWVSRWSSRLHKTRDVMSHDHCGLTSRGGDREVGLGPELAERVLWWTRGSAIWGAVIRICYSLHKSLRLVKFWI